MEEFRILVTCRLGEAAMQRFLDEPAFVVTVVEIKDEETLARALPGFHALIVRSNVRVTAEALRAGTDLLVVGRAGIGIDNIDVEAATRQGVAVVNAPSGNIVTTAEHTLALLFAVARNISRADRSMKRQEWEKNRFLGRELKGKTLGVIGAGRVGQAVAERAQALKMTVVACDPYLQAEAAARLGVECVTLEELLARADCLTVHTPLTAETRGLLGADAFARCKKGVFVINCARGGIVDEDALLAAIEAGTVAGAALDVFAHEPPPPHPLYQREEVVLTPHLGASTVEAQESVAVEIAGNVSDYLLRGCAPNLINLPQASSEVTGALEPYVALAETLGRFAAQTIDGAVERVRVAGWGESVPLADGMELVSAGFLKGFLSTRLTSRVNRVNAPAVAQERGIRVTVANLAEPGDFSDLVSVELEGAWGVRRLEGALFGKKNPRLVRLDDFRLDAVPRGHMILVYNDDVPGVVGALGNCLGGRGVNIAGLYNGRKEVGGLALTLLNVDERPDEGTLAALRALPHVVSARSIES